MEPPAPRAPTRRAVPRTAAAVLGAVSPLVGAVLLLGAVPALAIPGDTTQETVAPATTTGTAPTVSPAPTGPSDYSSPAESTPAITLSSSEGTPGTAFTATVTGFDVCRLVTFNWDGQPLGSGSFLRGVGTGSLEVPALAGPGPHEVTAACQGVQTPPATFNVIETPAPTLTLDPVQGEPGTSFSATVTGFDACSEVAYRWDGERLGSAAGGDGAATFAVPSDASATDHAVTAACDGVTTPPATFTVVAAAKPTLTLDKSAGPPGSPLTASGSGFACGPRDRVELRWDDDTVLTDAPSGTFSDVAITVPEQASVGDHTVVASCAGQSDINDSRPFTVTSETFPVEPPALTLRPAAGRPGDTVVATGDRFVCADSAATIQLSWDNRVLLPDARLDPSGHFESAVTVPDTTAARLTLRASCRDQSLVKGAGFAVAAPPEPESNGHGIGGWLIVLLVALAIAVALAAVFFLRTRPPKPQPKQKPPIPRAETRHGPAPLVNLRETPEHGEATHALRVEVSSRPSTPEIREVDDDHTAV